MKSRNDTGQQSGRIRNLQNPPRGTSNTIKIGNQSGQNEKKVNGMGMIRGLLHLNHHVWRGSFHCTRGYRIERDMNHMIVGVDMVIDESRDRLVDKIDMDEMIILDRTYTCGHRD